MVSGQRSKATKGMEAAKGVAPAGEQTAESRRARLWLGYSEDNLRNRDNLETRQVQVQQEEANPTPRDRGNENAPRHPQSARRHIESRGDNSEDGGLPNSYANLDELAAPSPIANSQQERQQGCLDDRNAANGSAEDELTVPLPFANSKKLNGQGYLENRTSGSPSSDEKPKQEVPTLRPQVSRLATELYTGSSLVFFSIFATLARLGLQALTFYPGAPVQTGLLWANVGGSLLMGFLSEDRQLFREEWGPKHSPRANAMDEEQARRQPRSPSVSKRHAAVKKTLPLYIGLATGFCGSFTSFSSFIRDAFFAMSNALKVPISHPSSAPISETIALHRNPGYSFLALLAVLITTIGLSLVALQFGAHMALLLEPVTPSIPFLLSRRVVDRLFVLLGWGCWLAAILMAIFPPDRPGGPVDNANWAQETWRSQALFALVFAPLGCLLRFYASLYLNSRIKAFPLGTFAVNILGTAMEAMFLDLQRVPIGGMVGCQVLQGMSDGFCGCLTTVSTWVAELTGLRLRHAYFYGMMSVTVAFSLMVIIMGSLQWKVGFKDPLCIT